MLGSRMNRYFYSESINHFCASSSELVLGTISANSAFDNDLQQTMAWQSEIALLQSQLSGLEGHIYFEFVIPRMGSRVDVVLVVGPAIILLEFKVGSTKFESASIDQVVDYYLDLRNFHSTSHEAPIYPILVATEASPAPSPQAPIPGYPIQTSAQDIRKAIEVILGHVGGPQIDAETWERGVYNPTPTIIEAARALFEGHDVREITRTDAGATNLSVTSQKVNEIIEWSRANRAKSICFVTGVPGAGKTLVGLDVASKHNRNEDETKAVFLSGNQPLVSVLQEALARDRVASSKKNDRPVTKKVAAMETKVLIQIVHHYRDSCYQDQSPPHERVAIFDESQRAWDEVQTASFMKQKKGVSDFGRSEASFLISCLDRHYDWATVICLVGGGQEINKGEAGISLWMDSVVNEHPDWHMFISSQLRELEFGIKGFEKYLERDRVNITDDLHLAVSMRSFRSESVAGLVAALLEIETQELPDLVRKATCEYPIVLTRDIGKARNWLKSKAQGSERIGMVAASTAERLRPIGIHVKAKADPVHYFLAPKDDVRSSYYLEESASEFEVQGLELDWTCLTWDGDFRFTPSGWQNWAFRGNRWEKIRSAERQRYQKNAYRVLLTRARQGMVICVPYGSTEDPTRQPEYYDGTFDYLRSQGFPVI